MAREPLNDGFEAARSRRARRHRSTVHCRDSLRRYRSPIRSRRRSHAGAPERSTPQVRLDIRLDRQRSRLISALEVPRSGDPPGGSGARPRAPHRLALTEKIALTQAGQPLERDAAASSSGRREGQRRARRGSESRPSKHSRFMGYGVARPSSRRRPRDRIGDGRAAGAREPDHYDRHLDGRHEAPCTPVAAERARLRRGHRLGRNGH